MKPWIARVMSAAPDKWRKWVSGKSITASTFRDSRLVISDCKFKHVIFVDCIIYYDGEPAELDDVRFDRCLFRPASSSEAAP